MLNLTCKAGLVVAMAFFAVAPSGVSAKEWGTSGHWKIWHSAGRGCNIVSSMIAGAPANSTRHVLIGYDADRKDKDPVTIYVTNFAPVSSDKTGKHNSTLSFGRSSTPLVSGQAEVAPQSSSDSFPGFKFFTAAEVLGAMEQNEHIRIAVPELGISEVIELPGARAAITKLRDCAEDARRK